jgi:hypothetical protein
MLLDENVILENERDPEFRRRLITEMERVRTEVERLRQVVDNVS